MGLTVISIAEPFAPKDWFGKQSERFSVSFANSENEANLLELQPCSQAPDVVSYLPRMNLKRAILKKFVFDWGIYFCLCEVYRFFQKLVGLELPIKNTLS